MTRLGYSLAAGSTRSRQLRSGRAFGRLVDVDDTFGAFDTGIWSLNGSATYDSTNTRVQLNAGSGDTRGSCALDSGMHAETFNLLFTFTNGADGADEVQVNFYANADYATDTFSPVEGYGLSFDHYNDRIQLVSYSGGTETSMASAAVTLGAQSYTARAVYDGAQLTVDLGDDGTTELSHSFSADRTYSDFFVSARDGGITGDHYLNELHLTAPQ